jgi:hypothetical protein
MEGTTGRTPRTYRTEDERTCSLDVPEKEGEDGTTVCSEPIYDVWASFVDLPLLNYGLRSSALSVNEAVSHCRRDKATELPLHHEGLVRRELLIKKGTESITTDPIPL